MSIVFVCIFLWGWPYESKVPLGKATIPVDQKLFGTWETSNPNDDYLVISKAGEMEYSIVLMRDRVKPEKCKGFVTMVNNLKFMNIYWIEHAETKYSFYKFDLRGNTLKTIALTDSIKKVFNTSFELKEYVEKNLNQTGFYEKDETVFTKK